MRHRVAGYKLGRTTSHRIAMTRNMAASLIEHERIITTLMWSEDEDIRSEAQALMRAEATSLSSVAKLMDHDELERRKEGLNITLEVANRLEAKEEWLAELRYRAKLESDEDLLATIERLIKDITHEEGEVDGVRTRRRLGN